MLSAPDYGNVHVWATSISDVMITGGLNKRSVDVFKNKLKKVQIEFTNKEHQGLFFDALKIILTAEDNDRIAIVNSFPTEIMEYRNYIDRHSNY